MGAGVEEADVVVVGGGGAGLAAAAEAARFGRHVILLEKEPRLGGSTAWSVGSITATGTPHQRARGIKDSPDEHFADLELLAGPLAGRDNRILRRILVDGTTDMLDWLMSLGLEFVGPHTEPPHRVPRMHNVLPNARAFPHHLGRHCRRLGVDIRLGARMVRLLKEGGRVAGVAVETGVHTAERRTVDIRARSGVVLASGDYSGSPALKARFADAAVAALEPVNPAATGDGFQPALDAGASVVNGDLLHGPIMRFVPPIRESWLRRLPPSRLVARTLRWGAEHLPDAVRRPMMMGFLTTALGPARELFEAGAILVDAGGERFADERARPAAAVPGRPGKVAHIVMDDTIARQFAAWPRYVSTAPGIAYAYLDDYRRNRRDIFHRAATVEGLAASLGVPAAALKASMAGRLTAPPFTALGPVRSYVVFTDGGLAVTARLEVVGTDGAPIPGLYAAGSAGQGGLLLEGHGHHLGWAFVSGRIAGRHAAHDAVRRGLAAAAAP